MTLSSDKRSLTALVRLASTSFIIILREQERLEQQQRVESMLMEGLDSGKSVEATDDWWNSKRAALNTLHQPSA